MNQAGYDYCTAFFTTLAARGVTQVVVSPGSRSTPLTLSAQAVSDLVLTVHHDERSAGFFALGLAKASRRPVALICTSGTAAANYLPAVVEAFHGAVPLLVLTSDRPPELRERGAPQTIDQVGLYGTHALWSVDLPEPDESSKDQARTMARRAVVTALGPPAGPVHLNWPLRKPLEPPVPLGSIAVTDEKPPDRGAVTVDPVDVGRIVELSQAERGLIVAGPIDQTSAEAAAVGRFAATTGWPLLADATSQLRTGEQVGRSPVVSTAHHLLGCESLASLTPDVIVRIGGLPSSSVYERWLPECGAGAVALIDPDERWRDPTGSATERVRAQPAALLESAQALVAARGPSEWTRTWTDADAIASAGIEGVLDSAELSEAGLARALGSVLPPDTLLYASSSMPVRDLDLFLPSRPERLRLLTNRGANGIDGVTSSALGAAAAGVGPVVLLIGDLAFLHDAGGLLAAASLGLDLTLVVPNNDGGGIFSFLPIADSIPASEFQTLFHTPHGIDLSLLSAAAGAHHRVVRTSAELTSSLIDCIAGGGISVLEIPVDTAAGVAQRRHIEEVVRAAVDGRAA